MQCQQQTKYLLQGYPDNKARWAHVGPTWSRQDPRWANVGPTKFAVGLDMLWGVLYQVSRAGTSNYILQILWGVITCPCPWYLLVAQHSPYVCQAVNDMDSVFNDYTKLSNSLERKCHFNNCDHLLHQKLSKWQLPVHSVMKMSPKSTHMLIKVLSVDKLSLKLRNGIISKCRDPFSGMA